MSHMHIVRVHDGCVATTYYALLLSQSLPTRKRTLFSTHSHISPCSFKLESSCGIIYTHECDKNQRGGIQKNRQAIIHVKCQFDQSHIESAKLHPSTPSLGLSPPVSCSSVAGSREGTRACASNPAVLWPGEHPWQWEGRARAHVRKGGQSVSG